MHTPSPCISGMIQGRDHNMFDEDDPVRYRLASAGLKPTDALVRQIYELPIDPISTTDALIQLLHTTGGIPGATQTMESMKQILDAEKPEQEGQDEKALQNRAQRRNRQSRQTVSSRRSIHTSQPY